MTNTTADLINSGRAAVVATNYLDSMFPDSFQELNGELSVEESNRPGRINVNVELDRPIDLHRSGMSPRFDCFEIDEDTIHIEFLVEGMEVDELAFYIDMER